MRIGIDLGGSHIGVGLVDDNGKIVAKKEKELSNKYKMKIKSEIVDTVVQYVYELSQSEGILIKEIQKIGIASPGTIIQGHILEADNLGIKDLALVEILQSHFSIPIYLKNDAKCAAICEKEFGSLKSYQNAVFLTIGTGIGGAIIWNNELLIPKKYPGFEVGHMVIDKNGELCKCGKKGCFETYASMVVLKKKLIKYFGIEKEITGIEVVQLIQENKQNQEVQAILDTYVENLSIGISNLINIFEPEAISIGGSFVYYKDIFLDKLRQELKKNRLLFNDSVPEIVLATMKNDAGIIGASRIQE